MEQFGRAEVILDGSGYLEEAQEIVDVRLEAADIIWAWEGQGLVAEGAIRTYIYFQKEDGTVEGEGVEIPFHAVVAPPGSGPEEVQVRLDSIREEHRFDPEERSFSQTIRLELVTEAAEAVEAPPEGAHGENLAERDGELVTEGAGGDGSGDETPEPIAVEPARPADLSERALWEEVTGEAEPEAEVETAPEVELQPAAEARPEAEPQPEAEPEPQPALEMEPAPETAAEAEPVTQVPAAQTTPESGPNLEPEPVYQGAWSSAGAGPGLEAVPEPRSDQPVLDDSVIVWKPFPEE